jgi:hypothetical protein
VAGFAAADGKVAGTPTNTSIDTSKAPRTHRWIVTSASRNRTGFRPSIALVR